MIPQENTVVTNNLNQGNDHDQDEDEGEGEYQDQDQDENEDENKNLLESESDGDNDNDNGSNLDIDEEDDENDNHNGHLQKKVINLRLLEACCKNYESLYLLMQSLNYKSISFLYYPSESIIELFAIQSEGEKESVRLIEDQHYETSDYPNINLNWKTLALDEWELLLKKFKNHPEYRIKVQQKSIINPRNKTILRYITDLICL